MDFVNSLLGTKKKDPKKAVQGRINAKKKHEKKTLGLTEKQQDYLFFIVLTVGATVYAYYKVDWEYTIWPRNLGDVCQMTTDAPHTSSGFDIWVTPNTQGSWEMWHKAMDEDKLEKKDISVILFHSELVDLGGSQLLPRADGYDPRAERSILNLVEEGTVNRILWVKPPWSKHFWGSNLTKAEQFFVGKTSDGLMKINCDDDYFVFNRLYAPKEEMTNPKPVHFQVLPLSDIYRRATVVPMSPAYLVHLDITYFFKMESIIHELRAKGMESRESKFLRAWQGGVCFNQEDAATKQAQFKILEQSINKVFEKELWKLPKDIFVSRVKNTFPFMCDDKGDIIWSNLWHVLSNLNADQLEIIRQKGLPAEAGTTAMPTEKQVSAMMTEAMTFLTKTGLPAPRIITAADAPQLANLTAQLGSHLHYTFGQDAVLHRLEEFPGQQEGVESADEKKAEE